MVRWPKDTITVMTQSTKYKLREIAEIAIGYQHREKVSHVEHGSHRLIQGKDIVRSEELADDSDDQSGWRVLTQELDRVTPKGDASRYRIQPGDLLFVSRGTTNIAVPLVEPFIRPMPFDWDTLIPAYVFYILRPDRQRVLPEYLAWFINQPPSQAFLARHSRGTLVKLLPKGRVRGAGGSGAAAGKTTTHRRTGTPAIARRVPTETTGRRSAAAGPANMPGCRQRLIRR
jgi:hypothetical protein